MARSAAAAALAVLSGLAGTAAAETDSFGGLPATEGREVVYAVCSGCHSIRLVTQQGMSRSRWDALLDWMVEEQGMAPLDAGIETTVLDYLAEHYNEDHRVGGAGGGAPSPYGTVSPLGAPD